MSHEKALLRMDEVAEILGISRARAYTLVAEGAIPSVRIGRSRRVPVRQLGAWIEKQVVDARPSSGPTTAAHRASRSRATGSQGGREADRR